MGRDGVGGQLSGFYFSERVSVSMTSPSTLLSADALDKALLPPSGFLVPSGKGLLLLKRL